MGFLLSRGGLTLLAIFLVLDLYSFQAWKTVVQKHFGSYAWLMNVVYILISLLGIIIFYRAMSTYNPIIQFHSIWNALLALVLLAYLSKLLIGSFMLLEDIYRILAWLFQAAQSKPTNFASRRSFFSSSALLLGGTMFGGFVYGVLKNVSNFKIHNVNIPVPEGAGFMKGLRVVQISDTHMGTFLDAQPLQKAFDLINELKPDLIFFTGDLVNNYWEELVGFEHAMASLKSKFGVYSVFGNHDYGDYASRYYNDKSQKAISQLKIKEIKSQAGWQGLYNEHRVIDINGKKLGIIGVENISGKHFFRKYGDMQKASQDCVADYKILLSHDPSHWDSEVIPQYKDVNLTLSGHTHGFQFGIENQYLKFSPAQWIYPKWAGKYQEGDQFLYVNRGLGCLGYPGRLGILPEITCIEFV